MGVSLTMRASISGLNLVSHLAMLQGAVPEALVPNGEYAFIGQAWSISLEWQFYLIAPLIFYLCERGDRKLIVTSILTVCGLYLITRHRFGEGWVFKQSMYFFVGIVSFFIWRADLKFSPKMIGLLMPV